MRTAVPGTGWSVLSKITPLMRVAAGSPATFEVATKAAGDGAPGKVAWKTLLPAGPATGVIHARPSLSVVTVAVVSPPNDPPPRTTEKVTGTFASRLPPASTTMARS